MRRMLAIVTVVVALATARPALAYTFSCSDFASAFAGTDQNAQETAVGYIAGVTDFLAGLLCFVGSAQCQCVQNLVGGQPMMFAQAIVTHINQCVAVDGTQAAFGSISRGAKDLCPY
ncbi:MAG TPA: hypothetical protein VEI94_04315 [Candidatus Bathyarchaeia archaeon]|nr:hypothetical protein [Candidatus Bathyarchaeia archaeon]